MRKFTDSSELGFALKEILVVAVVLGGVGALVVPQFTNASVSTRDDQVKPPFAAPRLQRPWPTRAAGYVQQHRDRSSG